jgi:hypothetical protein
MERGNTTKMKYIDWVKDVMSGKIIPLPRVPTYQFKPVNSVCDSEKLKKPLGKVCRFPPPPSTKKKDIGIH